MEVLLIKDENGQYENEQGEKFNIICCSWVKGERAKEFTEFITLQEALEYYRLTDPNALVKEETEEPTVSETENVENKEE